MERLQNHAVEPGGVAAFILGFGLPQAMHVIRDPAASGIPRIYH